MKKQYQIGSLIKYINSNNKAHYGLIYRIENDVLSKYGLITHYYVKWLNYDGVDKWDNTNFFELLD